MQQASMAEYGTGFLFFINFLILSSVRLHEKHSLFSCLVFKFVITGFVFVVSSRAESSIISSASDDVSFVLSSKTSLSVSAMAEAAASCS